MKTTTIRFLLCISGLILCYHQAQAQSITKQKNSTMTTTDFTTTFVVNETPEQVFNAITNVRGWWSENIEGSTDKLNEEFRYHYKDIHLCRMKLVELIPNQKAVWLVLENHFNFTKDESEWTGTKLSFEISRQGDKTQVRFTHIGLVPTYECYDVCQSAWNGYVNKSLYSLITTGKGQPTPKDTESSFNEQLLQRHKASTLQTRDYHLTITVDATAAKAFQCINNIPGWWTENIEGHSQQLNDVFSVRFGDVHYSKQQLIEVVPDQKVVWLVKDSKLNFIKDQQEWTNTKIIFEITTLNGQTQVHFTHSGLVPEVECFNACSNAWGGYIQGSLRSLINTGVGQPAKKETAAR